MTVAQVRPYPWQSLARISRSEARLAAALADRLDASALAKARSALSMLLDVEVDARPGPVGVLDATALAGTLPPTLVAVALEGPAGRAAFELDPTTSLALVDRVLGGEGAAPPAPALLTPVEQGVMAFAAARACEGLGVSVVDVVTTREGLGAWLGAGAIAWWSLSVVLGARTSSARLWVPARSLTTRAQTLCTLDVAADLTVALHAEVGRAQIGAAVLTSLGPGDLVLPDELLAERGPDGPRWSELRLRARGGAIVVALDRTEQGGFRVRERRQGTGAPSAARWEDEMSESEVTEVGTDELSEVAEVPVELSIELGRIELRVRELAALVPGRVLSARLPVGGEVTLRAGDRVIATGELVDVEGELGVRITARR